MPSEKKKIDLTPLNENETGQIEGGFAEMQGSASSGVDEINPTCPTNIVMCGCRPTTAPQ